MTGKIKLKRKSPKTQKHIEILKMIGTRAQFFRQQRDLTQEELAFRINKSKDTISNIERGSAGSTIETLIDLSEELKINMADLFDIPILNKINKGESDIIRKIIEIVSGKNDVDTLKSYLNVLEEMERVSGKEIKK